MSVKTTIGFIIILLLVGSFVSCSRKKNPPRDEIPIIKDVLAKLENAIENRNSVMIDSLLAPDAARLGYSSRQILSSVYPDSSDSPCSFGKRSFMYIKNKARIDCTLLQNGIDHGRPIEITMIKKRDQWWVERFDLK